MDISGRRRSATPNLEAAYLQAHGDTLPLDMTRRNFMRFGGALLAAGIAANELATLWADESYRSNGTELRLVGGENIDSNLLAVSFGGEGNFSDYYGGKSLFEASNKNIPTADMIYDNKNGLNFKDMGQVLKDSQTKRGFQYLIVNGDSMGAMFGLYAALFAEIPIAAFIANSGIMKLENAKPMAVLTAKLVTSDINPTSNLVGNVELAAKDLYCYFRDADYGLSYPGMPIGPEAILGLPHELRTLPDQMASGASPILQRDELSKSQLIDLPELAPLYKRKGIISRDFTEAIYLQAWYDNVIDPDESFHDFHDWYEKDFGIYMHRHFMREGSGHADVFAAGALLRKMHFLDAINKRFNGRSRQTIV